MPGPHLEMDGLGELNEVRGVSLQNRRSHTNSGPETNRIADNFSAGQITTRALVTEEETRPSRSRVRCSERLQGRSRRDYALLDRVGFRSPLEEDDRRPPEFGLGAVSKRVGVAPFPAAPMKTWIPNGGGALTEEAPVPRDEERLHRGVASTVGVVIADDVGRGGVVVASSP